MADKILVIDCGSQYSHLITREIRRLGVFSELIPAGSFNEKFVKGDVKGVIISGGPDSVYNKESPKPVVKKESVWMSHGDEVYSLPKEFKILAESEGCIAAFADEERNIYGLQFHPEVAHTKNGMRILENFVFDICQCKKGWDMS